MMSNCNDAKISSFTHVFNTTREDREKQNRHESKVIWFTGLSGSGKSTLADAVEIILQQLGVHTYILDGDNVRAGLNKDLGFSKADRIENMRRVTEVSSLMVDAGLVVLVSLISPFRAEREAARNLIGSERFFEVYVNACIETCELRDTKGLYKDARRRLFHDTTVIDNIYEPPTRPDILIEESMSIEMACLSVLQGIGMRTID